MSRLIPWKPTSAPNAPDLVEMGELRRKMEALTAENEELRRDLKQAQLYIRSRTDRLLEAAGTIPLRPEELDDATLLELDPIGIVAETFSQILEHSNETNAALRVAHGEIAAVFDSVGAGVLVLDTDHRICSYNREAAEKLLGGHPTPEGRHCYQVICNRESPREQCTLDGVLRTQDTYRRRDWVNRDRHYDVIATPLRGRDGKIAQVVLVYLDITDRLLSQRALEASETRYRDLVENAHDLIQSVNPDGRFEFVNEAWRRRLGYSKQDIETLTLFDVVDPGHHALCHDLMERLARDGQVPHVEVLCRTKAGEQVVLEGNINCISANGRMVATRVIFRDVTELRRAREESARVERLESIGLLAGGIAHDFNNLLTAMLHNLALVRADVPAVSHPRLADTETAVLRAQGLTQQLLTFSRGGEPVRQPVSLPELLADALRFALAGSATSHRIECAPDLPAVYADPGQLGQVLQNLALNAAQAMASGGNLMVRACRSTRPTAGGESPPDQPWVELRVSDDGPGIPRDHLERIFDPYFTTRSDGTGLGLATVHSIVQRHGGHITVESEPGHGACFHIYLPALTEPTQVPDAVPSPAPAQGRGHILLMDDEQMILDAAGELLTCSGFEVETATDGAEALARYRAATEAGDPFGAVVMDLTVPGGMGGAEAIRHLREFDPGVVAVVSSGYCNDPVMANYREHGFAAVAPKPYRMSTLVELLGRLLPPPAA